MDTILFEETLCKLQLSMDHECNGIWDLWGRSLEILRLVANPIILRKTNIRDERGVGGKEVPVVAKILQGSSIFLTMAVFLAPGLNQYYTQVSMIIVHTDRL